MNASDSMLAGTATAQGKAAAEGRAPAAAVPGFDYTQVAMALSGAAIGSASTPHMLTITAQLAAMLRARISSGELAPSQPIPGESALMRQYGVTQDTVRKAVRVLAGEGLVYVVQGRGTYAAARGK